LKVRAQMPNEEPGEHSGVISNKRSSPCSMIPSNDGLTAKLFESPGQR